jgi:dipeptidyl aminopeptidase/acylaminoacyl peptidase
MVGLLHGVSPVRVHRKEEPIIGNRVKLCRVEYNLETARRQHIRASPLYWVTPDAAPTLCIHGTEDKYVAHEQAVWLVERLKAAGAEAQLLTLEGAGHGFKGKDAETAEKALFAFFEKHLKGPTRKGKRD